MFHHAPFFCVGSLKTLRRAPPSFPSLLRLGTRGRRLPPPLPTHHNALQLLVPLLLGMGTTTACSDDDTEPRPFSPFHGILQCKIGGEIFPPLLFQPITVPLAQLVPSVPARHSRRHHTHAASRHHPEETEARRSGKTKMPEVRQLSVHPEKQQERGKVPLHGKPRISTSIRPLPRISSPPPSNYFRAGEPRASNRIKSQRTEL